MGFSSFLGRVLFASIFILSARQMYNEFGIDGGPAAKQFDPKLAVIQRYLTSKLGDVTLKIDVSNFVAAAIVLKGLGGFLFVFGSPFGAYLLLIYLGLTTPLIYDFYSYSYEDPQFHRLLGDFLQCLALFGALLFFIGMKNAMPRKQLKKKGPKAKTT